MAAPGLSGFRKRRRTENRYSMVQFLAETADTLVASPAVMSLRTNAETEQGIELMLNLQIRDGIPFSLNIKGSIVVLAGPNGAGKSRLLHNLNMWNWAARGPGVSQQQAKLTTIFLDDQFLIPVSISSNELNKIDVRLGNLVTSQNPSSIDIDWTLVRQYYEVDQTTRETIPIFTRLAKHVPLNELEMYSTATENRKQSMISALWLKASSTGLTRLQAKFSQYHRQYAALKYAGEDPEKIAARLGEAPWIFVNRQFQKIGLHYEILPPDIDNVLPDQLGFYLRRKLDGLIVEGDSLSSGERVMLVLYDFMERYSDTPHALLIDDVDSLLHPPNVEIVASHIRRIVASKE